VVVDDPSEAADDEPQAATANTSIDAVQRRRIALRVRSVAGPSK
jgi:hypothetical protein